MTTPAAPAPRRGLRARDLIPLVAYVIPTVVIGYGWVMPRNGAGGVNELSVGFASAIAGACVTYVIGVRAARRS
jgi:ABC-type Fe3+ transport system permease subunit